MISNGSDVHRVSHLFNQSRLEEVLEVLRKGSVESIRVSSGRERDGELKVGRAHLHDDDP